MNIPSELVGTWVTGVVTRVAHYGVYLSYRGNEILVLIPDVSDEPVRDLPAFVGVGEERRVKVLRHVVGEATRFVGTFTGRDHSVIST